MPKSEVKPKEDAPKAPVLRNPEADADAKLVAAKKAIEEVRKALHAAKLSGRPRRVLSMLETDLDRMVVVLDNLLHREAVKL